MALSNWDALALNHDSTPVRGAVENHRGVTLQIYKNWLYIADPLAKKGIRKIHEAAIAIGHQPHDVQNKHYGYVDDIVAEFHSGKLIYGGWTIYGERGPKAGIYVVAESHRSEQIDGTYTTTAQAILVGCGVYGFRSDLEVYRPEMEAEGTDVDDLIAAIERDDAGYTVGWSDGQVEIIQSLPTDTEEFALHTVYTGPEKPAEYVGVEPADVEHLRGVIERAGIWTPDDAVHPRDLDLSKALRFNPGDGFFSDHLGTEFAGTEPGQAATPLLMQMMHDDRDE